MINVELKIVNAISSRRRDLGRLIAVFFMILCTTSHSFASSTENFSEANEFYAEGKYQEAIDVYQSLLNADHISPDIYFNLGNCFYKKNDIPNAILNYEKALKLKPDSEDALFNLKMANKRTIDKMERLPELFIGNTWKTIITAKTVESWAYYTVGFIFLALLLFVIYLLIAQVNIKKAGFYAGLLFLGVSMFSLLMASQHNAIIKQSSEAIIFVPTMAIKSEPNENAEKLFTLHEGTKVLVVEQLNEWSKIKLPNGNIGWIKSDEIKRI